MNVLTSARDIRNRLKTLGLVKVAVAYIGSGWQKYVSPSQLTEIIVSPTMGSNPKAIEQLIKVLGYSKVHFLNQLHAKLYIGNKAMLLGSCNLSDNGLADSRLQEAAVFLSDSDALAISNTTFDEYRRLSRLQYPNAAAKKKQLTTLMALWQKAEWNGCLPSNEKPVLPSFLDYVSDLDRIHISWYQPIDLKYDTKAIGAIIPDAHGVSPDHYFSDAMTFLEDDDIQVGDWILCWPTKNNGLPRDNGKLSWMQVHHVVPHGVSDDYSKLAGQAADREKGTPPFHLDGFTTKLIRDALASRRFPEFISQNDDRWSQPPVTHSKRFLTYVRKTLLTK